MDFTAAIHTSNDITMSHSAHDIHTNEMRSWW